MDGIIKSYRRGRHTQNTRQAIVLVDNISSKEKAEKLIGKKVTWQTPGKNKKNITGKVSASHGSKGAVRVIFDTGIPGQAVTQKVKIE
jgi:large subunit ribosomal protein L35Ae